MAIYWYIFFFGLTSTAWRIRGYSVGVGPVPDVNFVLENEYKLYNAPVPEGYVIFSIPSSMYYILSCAVSDRLGILGGCFLCVSLVY